MDRGKAAIWFLSLFLVKMMGDTLDLTIHWNPWPHTFNYYVNPAYRMLDFIIGYLGYQVLVPLKSKWTPKQCSFLQISSLAFYFLCCVLFDKLWGPAPFILISILLIMAFMLPCGIIQPICEC